jgi:hypothetical protein
VKKIFIIIFIIVCGLAYSQDFRQVKWGMSKEDVKKTEKLEIYSESETFLFYNIVLNKTNMWLIYKFIDNKLYLSAYTTYEKYTNGLKYIEIYESFKDSLTKKYGNPTGIIDNVPDEYIKYPQYLETGLLTGKVNYNSFWTLPKTEIVCKVYGGEYSAKTLIQYGSVEYKYLEQKQIDKETKDNL